MSDEKPDDWKPLFPEDIAALDEPTRREIRDADLVAAARPFLGRETAIDWPEGMSDVFHDLAEPPDPEES